MRTVMKTIEAVVFAAALWAVAASAEELTPERSRAIVERQFEAFARDDAEAAYALADPTIKQKFVDADHFLAMVRDRYRPGVPASQRRVRRLREIRRRGEPKGHPGRR